MTEIPELIYWRKGEKEQNFGDSLSSIIFEKLFYVITDDNQPVRIIGSSIHDWFSPSPEEVAAGKTVVFWGCGIRERGGLSDANYQNIDVLTVRGPISAKELRLGRDVPLGDTALVMPALYQPRLRAEFRGKSVCIPHFHDRRPDDELLAKSGCDLVLRPNIRNGAAAIYDFIDAVYSADFVLSASLHGAIIAAAYGRPFAYGNFGSIDLPLKWEDFARSVDIPCQFFDELAPARSFYQDQIKDCISIPSMWPALARAPFLIRYEALLQILAYEVSRLKTGEATVDLRDCVTTFSRQAAHFDAISQKALGRAKAQADAIRTLQTELERATALAETKAAVAKELEDRSEELRALLAEQISISDQKANADRHAFQLMIDDLGQRKAELETGMAALREKLEANDRVQEQIRIELDAKLAAATSKAQVEIEQARQEAAAAQAGFERRLAQMQKEAGDAARASEALERRLEQAQREAQGLRLASEADRLRHGAQIGELEGALKNENDDLRQRLDAVRHALQRREWEDSDCRARLKGQIEILRKSLESEQVAFGRLNVDLADTVTRNRREMARTRQELAVARRHARSLSANLALTESKLRQFTADSQHRGLSQAKAHFGHLRRAAADLWAFRATDVWRNQKKLAALEVLVRQSGLFDLNWYLVANPDVPGLGVDPLRHYLLDGQTRRSPNPIFDAGYYLATYEDVRQSGLNPLVHYLVEGAARGYDPHPLFRTAHYLSRHPEAVASGTMPLAHYLSKGEAAADCHPLFDDRYYAASGAEIKGSGLPPLVHYLTIGVELRLSPNPIFNAEWYVAQYPDAAGTALDPLSHYLVVGAAAGYDPHPLFSCAHYGQVKPDVATSPLTPLEHYFLPENAAGPAPHPLFDGAYYLSTNPDAAGFNPLAHYLWIGGPEGRSPHPLFDSASYFNKYPDARSSSLDPLSHYLAVGAAAGYDPNPLFDGAYYLASHPEVLASSQNPLLHYLNKAGQAGINPHPLFDGAYYLSTYPDVRQSGLNPLVHYLRLGGLEGRQPHPLFDGAHYLATYPDVAQAGFNPLAHYLQSGGIEGRQAHPLFDGAYYLATYPDVAQAGLNPLMHYLQSGGLEGRQPHPLFDGAYYLAAYRDVAQAGLNPLVHYLRLGGLEGRQPHPLFDGAHYLATYPDVARAGMVPLVHYMQTGGLEGRQPHPLFDGAYYLATYPDVAQAGFNPLAHYLQSGGIEGRQAHPLFDGAYYLATYPDVAQAGLNPLMHYLQSGGLEGRQPHPLFDGAYYLAAYPDVAEAGTNPLVHYLQSGALEGRQPHVLFDSAYYLSTYPDVMQSGLDSLAHYMQSGGLEGRRPHPLFDGLWYLGAYPDVRAAGVLPLEHYLRLGGLEGRQPHPLFDGAYYLSTYPDVRAARQNPLAHYLLSGAEEGRKPHLLFDGAYYLSLYLDVQASGMNPLVHYMQAGGVEGRKPHPLFDGAYYLMRRPDVRATGVTPLIDYLYAPPEHTTDPNPTFDTAYYLANNPDVIASGTNPLVHYLTVGLPAGRLAYPPAALRRRYIDEGFNPDWYAMRYSDVALSDLHPHAHYLLKGYSTGQPALAGQPAQVPIAQQEMHFPSVADPLVTIVIPVYKNVADTLRCLHSIWKQHENTRVSYSIVLADDCPDVPTLPLLENITGITVIENEQNLGFLRNCNNAARGLTSEFIVFLNNDTVVTPGWLDSMVAVAQHDQAIAMVGCKLLNADGTVQEAGGIIFRNGWGHPFGHGDDPFKPEYNYVREVDVVTGAAFLVRRSHFEEVGMLDTAFAPAFYEEFDLAFAFANAGYKVIYQPASEVYHLGSASYGVALRNKLSTINHDKFCRKWTHRLKNQAVGKDDLAAARERQAPNGVVLVIDDFVPKYDKHAGALTVFQYIQMLTEKGFKVIFLPDNREAIQPYTRVMQQLGIEVLTGDFVLEDWLRQNGYLIDWVWVARPDVAKKYIDILRCLTYARVIYYTHDLHFLREARHYEVDGDAWALEESLRLKPLETWLCQTVDCVTTPSSEEAKIIADLAPGQRIEVLPPYFYKPAGVGALVSTDDIEERDTLIFVGGFDHVPNVDAAILLVQEVMPLVWQEVPEARVCIVGNNPPASVKALAGDRVEVTGYVPYVEPYYQRSRMSVSPLRYGAGVKGKIVASLEAGIPVVTTTIGNEGINLKPEVEALVADDPADIANCVIRLFQSPELTRSLSEAGKKIIAERFSEERAYQAFLLALGKVECPEIRKIA
ncbi:glycosyltransferase [Nitrospirillum sp. BR 11752]|uniref:glycosyltransferase n=1 Tax=Nitrospirillum sp. BR 11752 TaxID=3104293 RepID=UPI002ECD56BB|nr:glycosyltransferase [Nitrospirillum sp. BR 11752]